MVEIADVVIGRLHRIEDNWVLAIVEHEGRDVRVVFRRDEIEITGEGVHEIVSVKASVMRKRPAPVDKSKPKMKSRAKAKAKVKDKIEAEDKPKMVDVEVPVEPQDAAFVKNRHQTPVVIPRSVMEKIKVMVGSSNLELTRP